MRALNIEEEIDKEPRTLSLVKDFQNSHEDILKKYTLETINQMIKEEHSGIIYNIADQC